MDNAEAVIAIRKVINDNSDSVNIVNLVKRLVLHIHFSVNAVNGFYSCVNPCITDGFGNSALDFLLRVLTANDGELSEDNKVALKFRCEREWHWEKQLISQQLKEQTDYLDEYVRKTI